MNSPSHFTNRSLSALRLYDRRMEYVPELTGLRALAVFLAISEHAAIPSMGGGWIGVDIFFVLSGYLITTILAAEWRRTDTIRLGRFYAKRAFGFTRR